MAARAAIDYRPTAITLSRLTGTAPNVTVISAPLNASVTMYQNDPQGRSEYEGKAPRTSQAQDSISGAFMYEDVAGSSYTLPHLVGDRITLSTNGRNYQITEVDMFRGLHSGLIYFTASGNPK